MRIGIVLSHTPGYSETFFNSKIKGLLNNGIEVQLFCQSKNNDFKLCPVIVSPKVSRNPFLQSWYFIKEFLLLLPHIPTVFRYIKLERKGKTGFLSILKKMYLNAHLLKAQLDWVHFGFATQALGSETVAKAIGAKMAVSLRGFDINVYPIKNPGCYSKLWKHVDKVHSISNYLLNKAHQMGLDKNSSSAIITPAIQLEKLPSKINLNNSGSIKIVTIARLTWIKGLDVSIAAMGILKEKGVSFKYYIIGDGDKNHTERYKFMVHELGLKEEIIFMGKQCHEETLTHLSNADIYLQPSLNEGFCNAVLEAQALGIPTIASNVGGLPENILHKKTGWLFENRSSESLVEKVEEVLGLYKEEKEKIAQNAKRRVLEEFNIEKQNAEFLDFYELKGSF